MRRERSGRLVRTDCKFQCPEGVVHFAMTARYRDVRITLCEDVDEGTCWESSDLEPVEDTLIATCIVCNLALPEYKKSKKKWELYKGE